MSLGTLLAAKLKIYVARQNSSTAWDSRGTTALLNVQRRGAVFAGVRGLGAGPGAPVSA